MDLVLKNVKKKDFPVLKSLAKALGFEIIKKNENNAVLVITHYQRLLDYIVPDFVHVLMDGKIVKSGTAALALELEEKGYDWIKEELEA